MIPQSRYFCTRQDIYWKRLKRRKIKVKIRIEPSPFNLYSWNHFKIEKISNKWSGLNPLLGDEKIQSYDESEKASYRSIFEIHLRNPGSFIKRRNAVRNAHFICRFSLVCEGRWSGDRLSGKSSSKNRENYPMDRKWEKRSRMKLFSESSSHLGEERRLLRRRDLYRCDALTSMLKSSIFNAQQRVDRTR